MDISLPIDAEVQCDVLVVGGGMAAICAAIAAARNGCDTCLVEMDQCLGGNGGPLLGVHVSGAHSFHPYASETGIIEELELEAARRAPGASTTTSPTRGIWSCRTSWKRQASACSAAIRDARPLSRGDA
jgi:ribulose 1,5-bisphosphate synthetase/thiazole synthase